MAELAYRTAGESHGVALITMIEGLPAGLTLDVDAINHQLRRRQGGYGRSGRQKIERDAVCFKTGVRRGATIGSPLVVELINRDARIDTAPEITRPRPGHADFAGSIKWLTTDCRAVLERASARETAARVVAGSIAQCLLAGLDIEVVGFVRRVGGVEAELDDVSDLATLRAARDANDAYCPDAGAAQAMIEQIRAAKRDGETLGGIVEVVAVGQPPGLGTCVRWQDKLDGRLMQAVGAIGFMVGPLVAVPTRPRGAETPRDPRPLTPFPDLSLLSQRSLR